MKLFQIEERNISDIIIQDRTRNKVQNIPGLMENITLVGQLSPILISPENHLIDGLRRITAMKELKRETIEVRVVDGITQDDHYLIELFSNLDRDEYLWHEEIDLKYKLHAYWKNESEKNNTSWGYRETSKRLRCSLGGLSTDLAFAEALKVFPELREQSTKGRAKEAYKALGKQASALQQMNNFTDQEKERLTALQSGKVEIQTKNTISVGALEETKKAHEKIDSLDQSQPKVIKLNYVAENYKTFIDKFPDNSIGMVELDPPYAINFNETYGKTSKIQSKAIDWTEKELYEFYFNYLPLIHQKMLNGSWVLCWTGKEHYLEINRVAKEIGFATQQPGVWPKPGGSTNQPKTNMISNWEMFLLFRKGKAQFNTPSFPSAIPEMITNASSQRIHQWEKPIALYDYFLERLGMSGTIFMSPFAGSGNCLISAAKFGMVPIGCDKLQKYIPQFYQNAQNYFGLNTKIEML